MSDAPQAPDWWQASDLKWYPPSQQPGTIDGDRDGDGRRWVTPTVIVVVVALIAAVAAFVVVNRGDDASAAGITLEPAASTGPDPFTESVAIGEVATFPDSVKAVATELTDRMHADDGTGTLLTTGTTPGLFGGTRDNTACDAGKLVSFLTSHPDKGRAWAATQHIAFNDLASYIGSLTPAVLTTDTLVTNHGFRNGRATSRNAVLQAGTSVLVDATGTPRARCSCGNPLTPAARVKVSEATKVGTAWPGFRTEHVTVIGAGEPITTAGGTFTFTDLATGDAFQQPAASGGGLWVAVGMNSQQSGGVIRTSTDGTTWADALDSPDIWWNDVAHGDGRWVAVGGDEAKGRVVTSSDGRSWSTPTDMPFEAKKVAFGNGRWVALDETHVATSTDGTSWTAGAFGFPDQYAKAHAVAYGDGKFMAFVAQCDNRCAPYGTVTSTDGTSWTSIQEGGSLPWADAFGLAFRDRFAMVGYSWGDLSSGQAMSDRKLLPVAATLGASTWEPVQVTGTDGDFTDLADAGGSWIALTTPEWVRGTPTSLWRSTDLATWTKLTAFDAEIRGVAVAGGGAGGGTVSGGGTTPTSAPTTTSPRGSRTQPTTTARASGRIDRSAKVLRAMAQLTTILAQDPASPAQLATAAAQLTQQTGVTWTSEMLIGLASSACNDWDTDPSDPEAHHITEKGYADWANAVGPALGITPKQARTAIDSKLWGPFQRLCG